MPVLEVAGPNQRTDIVDTSTPIRPFRVQQDDVNVFNLRRALMAITRDLLSRLPASQTLLPNHRSQG